MPILSDTRLTELGGRIKLPAVAGLFYPADPTALQQSIREMLASITPSDVPPKALIAPHAGYIYSGPIAASAYATLIPARQKIKRVVLLGPAHRVPFHGLALPLADHFATPLGKVPIDTPLRDRIAGYPQVAFNDPAFAHEHSLEVHLPFLQTVLDQFTLLPVLVGDASADQVEQILQQVWGGDETLIVISSDLSHYHNYTTAVQMDAQTSEFIRTLQYTKLGSANACGCRPLHGLLQLAQKRNYEVGILDVRNSGDTAGSRDRVVGYGAYALYSTSTLRSHHHRQLLDMAASSIRHGFANAEPESFDIDTLPPAFRKPAAVFVTLKLDGELRGCIGNTEPVSPLATAVAVNAWNAAFRDPRFPPLSRDEYTRTGIGVSVLSEKTLLRFDSDQSLISRLQPGSTGLIIATGPRRATFLPSVWESIPEPEQFLARLKQKAGIGPLEPVAQAWVYDTQSFYGHPG